jgi:hypothetical protein
VDEIIEEGKYKPWYKLRTLNRITIFYIYWKF